MKTSNARAGEVIHTEGTFKTWASVSKLESMEDTYEVLISSQFESSKNPDDLQTKAQLFLSREAIIKLAGKFTAVTEEAT